MTTVSAMVAILASSVVVLAGLVALVRSIWKVAQTLRDNTKATQDLSGKLDGLAQVVDGRISRIEERLSALERPGKNAAKAPAGLAGASPGAGRGHGNSPPHRASSDARRGVLNLPSPSGTAGAYCGRSSFQSRPSRASRRPRSSVWVLVTCVPSCRTQVATQCQQGAVTISM